MQMCTCELFLGLGNIYNCYKIFAVNINFDLLSVYRVTNR